MAHALTSDSVKSKHIKDGQTKEPDLGAEAVTGPKLALNSVSGEHVASDSLTGAQILESSLGTVPSATSATAAASATTADDAETLDGLDSNVFERRSRFLVGESSNNQTTDDVIFSVENGIVDFDLLNDGDVDATAEVRIRATSSGNLHVLRPGVATNVPGNSVSAQIPADAPMIVQNGNNVTVHTLIICQVDTLLGSDAISCYGMRRSSPSQ